MFSDSRLVVSQIEGNFEARDHWMSQYLRMFESLRTNLQKVSVVRVPRSQNSHTYSLATLASSLDNCITRMISMEMLEQPSTEPQVVVATSSKIEPSQLDTYIAFLSNGSLRTMQKKLRRCRGQQLIFSYSKMGDCTGIHLEDHTFYVFVQAKLPSFWPNFTKEYAVATQGVDHSCTEP